MRLLLTASLALCLFAPVRAQAPSVTPPGLATVDPALFNGMSYRLVGPSRGGRVTAVTGVPTEPRTFYMGAASGGVFRTTDGGASWVPITDGKVPVGSIGAIAVADSDTDVIYVGTGSDGVRSNVSTGRGVYKSTDAGETWQFVGLYDVGQIGGLRIHPEDPDTVWVAANGDAFKSNPERGVYKTTDGGETWKQVLQISEKTGAMDVELQPYNPDVVYAWMSHLERKPWTIISGSLEGGFFKSTDGGETWRKVTNGLPNELIGKANLAVTADNPDRIYALIEAKPGGGLYRSDDAGESWQMVNDDGALIQRPFYYTTLGADPTNQDVVYGGAESFFKSSDGGVTMQRMSTPHGDNHDIWVNPFDGQTMIQSNDGGANVSFDGGATWSTQGNQPTGEFYAVWVDNGFPYKLYGAQQDSSTVIISSLADPYDYNDWTSGPGCETGPIIPHPTNPDIVYGSCKGQFEWVNLRTGITRPYWIGMESLYGNDARELTWRIQRTAPMETSVHDPEVLFYGTQYVHRTRDRGVTWETISPDLTWNPPHAQGGSGEPITRDVTGEEFYSTLYQIRQSLHDPDVIWVGSNDGPFHVTRDGGETWTDITPADLEPGGRVQTIEPSPHRRGSAYYATYRYLLGDYRPYIYKTDDYGQTWELLTDGTNGIPSDWPTRVIREDPDREGLLYAGTEFGMFISFDNGKRWQSFQLNLPNTPITDIKLHNRDLVVSTQGRAFWILDNVSSLAQLTAQSSPEAVKLYAPRPGYRTNLRPELLGPVIEYYLPEGTQGPVALEILDASGELVNTYTSEAGTATVPAAEPEVDPATAAMMQGRVEGVRGGGRGQRGGGRGQRAGGGRGQRAGGARGQRGGRGGGGRGRGGRGGGQGSQVPLNAGLNRFAWDVRHQVGLDAPPGSYQVRLTVGDITQTQPFEVLVDPRLALDGITAADLAEQFEHGLKMQEMMSSLNDLVSRVRNAQGQFEDATGAAAQTKAAVDAIADKLFTDSVRYGQPGLQEQINYLNRGSSRNDQKLGRDVVARYEVLQQELQAMIAELDRALGGR